MLPALLAARPLIKYGVLVGLPIVILIASHTTVYLKGKAATKQAWDASLAQQAAESVQQVSALYHERDEALRQRDDARRDVDQKRKEIERKLVTYAQKKLDPCETPADAIRLFDAIGGLFGPDQERVSAADAAAGKPDAAPETGVEITRLLLAYVRAYADAADQLATLWTDYDGLVQERRGQYIVEQAGFASD